MPEVQLAYCLQSDGVPEIGKGTSKQSNRPTDEQLKKQVKNGVQTWFEPVDIEDPRHQDWMKKLGYFLRNAVREVEREGGRDLTSDQMSLDWVLVNLPDYYVLYDHVRSAEGNADSGKKDERRDSYLYGHPGGPKKRFRSPADFFPHLWWLLSNETGDHDHCSCKMCTPDEWLKNAAQLATTQYSDEEDLPEWAKIWGNKEKSKPTKKQVKKGQKEKAEQIGSWNHIDDKPSPAKESSTIRVASNHTKVKEEPVIKAASSTPTPQPTSMYPAPRAQARHVEQLWDQQSNGFLYRPGELVWVIRETNSLALGLMLSRNMGANGTSQQYRIQLLSCPNLPQRQLEIEDDRVMYPWLAFSTPECLNASLRGVTDHFDNINWANLPQNENTVVDGSIFAAKAVDATFTLVQLLTPPGTPTMEFEYNGIYLGGELIWLGDAVRYRSSDEAYKFELAIVVKIAERMHTGSKPSEVYLVVDLYENVNESRGHAAQPPSQLPARVLDDLKYRSEARQRVLGETLNWKFTAGQLRIPLKSVLGRWYESRRILPVIKPELVQQSAQSGDIPDCGPYLNPRGNHLPPGNIGFKKAQRIQAFSRSVPDRTTINIDFDATLRDSSTTAPTSGSYNSSSYQTIHPVAASGGGDWPFIQTDPMDEQGYY